MWSLRGRRAGITQKIGDRCWVAELGPSVDIAGGFIVRGTSETGR